jgi:PAS domain S-box-containing protein
MHVTQLPAEGARLTAAERIFMKAKLLIVEDEPIVALDLQQEVEQLGCEVVGLAESADEALVAAEVCRPDLALMDVRIVGSMDGIQTARLLRTAYDIPVIFLTSYSDETTISRAAKEMPYGYLTKPFKSRELKATLRVALHKAQSDAAERTEREELAVTVGGVSAAMVTTSLDGCVRFMNRAAEAMTGASLDQSRGKPLAGIISLSDSLGHPAQDIVPLKGSAAQDEFGWTLNRSNGETLRIDLQVAPLNDGAGQLAGFVVTLRDATGRLRFQAIEETLDRGNCFDTAPMGMVQLDADGRVVRVNKALELESGVPADQLVGRSLTGLCLDPDPRIAKQLMHKLLKGNTVVATAPTPAAH